MKLNLGTAEKDTFGKEIFLQGLNLNELRLGKEVETIYRTVIDICSKYDLQTPPITPLQEPLSGIPLRSLMKFVAT